MKGGFYRKNTQNENLGYSFSALFRVDNNDGYREKFPSSIRFLFTSGGEIIDVSRLFNRFRIKWSVKSQDDENDFVKDVMGRSPNRNLLLSSHRVFLPFSLFFPSKAILKFSLIAFDLFSPRKFSRLLFQINPRTAVTMMANWSLLLTAKFSPFHCIAVTVRK